MSGHGGDGDHQETRPVQEHRRTDVRANDDALAPQDEPVAAAPAQGSAFALTAQVARVLQDENARLKRALAVTRDQLHASNDHLQTLQRSFRASAAVAAAAGPDGFGGKENELEASRRGAKRAAAYGGDLEVMTHEKVVISKALIDSLIILIESQMGSVTYHATLETTGEETLGDSFDSRDGDRSNVMEDHGIDANEPLVSKLDRLSRAVEEFVVELEVANDALDCGATDLETAKVDLRLARRQVADLGRNLATTESLLAESETDRDQLRGLAEEAQRNLQRMGDLLSGLESAHREAVAEAASATVRCLAADRRAAELKRQAEAARAETAAATTRLNEANAALAAERIVNVGGGGRRGNAPPADPAPAKPPALPARSAHLVAAANAWFADAAFVGEVVW